MTKSMNSCVYSLTFPLTLSLWNGCLVNRDMAFSILLPTSLTSWTLQKIFVAVTRHDAKAPASQAQKQINAHFRIPSSQALNTSISPRFMPTPAIQHHCASRQSYLNILFGSCLRSVFLPTLKS